VNSDGWIVYNEYTTCVTELLLRMWLTSIADHLMADRGACVSDCGAGRHANSDGKCVLCDGPCPKSEF